MKKQDECQVSRVNDHNKGLSEDQPVHPPAKASLGIRACLFLLLAIVILPIFLVQSYIHYDRFETMRAQELQANLELARSLGRAFDTFVHDALHHELAIAIAATASQPLSRSDFTRLLDQSAKDSPSVRALSWVSPGGRILASSNPEAIGIDLSERPYFKEIVSGREWLVTDLLHSKLKGEEGKPVFGIIRATRDDTGNLLGSVFASVAPEKLDRVMAFERSTGAGVSLIDSKGMLVYRYPPREFTWEERNLLKFYPVMEDSLKGKEITATITEESIGRNRFVGFTPVSSIGWVAAASRAEDVAMAEATSKLWFHGILFLLVTLAALGASLALSRPVSTSISKLRDHALALGRGEKENLAVASGPAEIKDLAEAFNRMAEMVRDREMGLRDSEERFRAFMGNNPAIAWIKDEQGRHLYLNKTWEDRFGVRLEDWQGKTDFEVWPLETAEQFRKNDQAVLDEGHPIEVTEETVNPDGSRCTWWNFKFPFLDASGNKYVGGIGVDLTERKRMEQELRSIRDELEERVQERTLELLRINEQLTGEIDERKRAEKLVRIQRDLALAFGSISDMDQLLDILLQTVLNIEGVDSGGVYLVDSTMGGLQLVSHKGLSPWFVERVSRYDPGCSQIEFVMRGEPAYWSNPVDLFETGDLFEKEGIKAIASIPVKWEGRVVALLNLASHKHDTIPFVTRSAIEATAAQIGGIVARVRAQELLRESEKKFRELAENIREVFWVRTAGEMLLYVSPAYEEIWGSSLESLYENPSSFMDSVHPDDREHVLKAFLAEQKQGLPSNEEYRIIRPDGKTRWIRARSFPVRETGKLVRHVGIAEDITERKEAEVVLRQSEGELRNLSSRLLSAQEEERKRIAHELHDSIGGSLGAVRFQLQNILEKAHDSPSLCEALKELISMVQLTADEARRIYANLRPSMLDDLGILTTIDWFTRQFHEIYSPVRIDNQIQAEEEDIPDALKIVIFRLMQEAFHNIAKYSKADLVRVSLSKKDGSIELAIADNGKGFDIHSSYRSREDRGGLGLASMRERVQLSGGVFSIESTIGEGTNVRASWPAGCCN